MLSPSRGGPCLALSATEVRQLPPAIVLLRHSGAMGARPPSPSGSGADVLPPRNRLTNVGDFRLSPDRRRLGRTSWVGRLAGEFDPRRIMDVHPGSTGAEPSAAGTDAPAAHSLIFLDEAIHSGDRGNFAGFAAPIIAKKMYSSARRNPGARRPLRVDYGADHLDAALPEEPAPAAVRAAGTPSRRSSRSSTESSGFSSSLASSRRRSIIASHFEWR